LTGPLWRALAGRGHRERWTRLSRLADGLAQGQPGSAYRRWISLFNDRDVGRLLIDRREDTLQAREFWWMLIETPFSWSVGGPVQAACYADYLGYLPHDILTKVDRASMAVALEVRSPFLDHRVVELALGLPSKWKLRGRRSKWILREAFKDIVPAQVWDQPKRGFALPLDRWFRGKLDGLLRESVGWLPGDVFNHTFINELIARHQSGREEHSQRLWALLWLGRWWKRFVG
jgi:asparagine synthase (glutamine-hydrolysing)